MNHADSLVRHLRFGRQQIESLLTGFQSRADWLSRPNDRCNHALWLCGHIGVTHNRAIGWIEPSRARPHPRFEELFVNGSRLLDNSEEYPPVEEVLEYMRERFESLVELTARLDDEALARPVPEGAPSFVTDVESLLMLMAWHEAYHGGQLSIGVKALAPTASTSG